MDAKLTKVYYSPQDYWKSIAPIKTLTDITTVPEKTAKQWLIIKQALWQFYLPAAHYIPRPKFGIAAPNAGTLKFRDQAVEELIHMHAIYLMALTANNVHPVPACAGSLFLPCSFLLPWFS